jgi:hypothetical protein
VSLAADHSYNRTMPTLMSDYIDSALHCHISLDRLDEYTIDQILMNSIQDEESSDAATSVSILSMTRLHSSHTFCTDIVN